MVAVESFFMQPFGDATLGKAGLIIIPIFVAFSTFGAANGSVYTSSRLIFGAARDHLLPDSLSGLHTKYKTPVPAIILLVSYCTYSLVKEGPLGRGGSILPVSRDCSTCNVYSRWVGGPTLFV